MRYADDYNGRTCPYCNEIPFPGPPHWRTILPWYKTQWTKGLLDMRSAAVAACPEYQKSAGDWYNGTYGYNGFYLVWGGEMREWTIPECARSEVTTAMIQATAKTVCFVDSLDGWATSPKSDQPWPPWNMTRDADRHHQGWNVSFCDGHCKWYSSTRGSMLTRNDYLWALDKSDARARIGT